SLLESLLAGSEDLWQPKTVRVRFSQVQLDLPEGRVIGSGQPAPSRRLRLSSGIGSHPHPKRGAPADGSNRPRRQEKPMYEISPSRRSLAQAAPSRPAAEVGA